MKNNHPIWEGHQFNTYKSKKACYNNTTDEEKLIREQHTKEKNVKKLGEVSRYVKEESISEFVQDFSEQQKKLRKIDIRRTK